MWSPGCGWCARGVSVSVARSIWSSVDRRGIERISRHVHTHLLPPVPPALTPEPGGSLSHCATPLALRLYSLQGLHPRGSLFFHPHNLAPRVAIIVLRSLTCLPCSRGGCAEPRDPLSLAAGEAQHSSMPRSSLAHGHQLRLLHVVHDEHLHGYARGGAMSVRRRRSVWRGGHLAPSSLGRLPP